MELKSYPKENPCHNKVCSLCNWFFFFSLVFPFLFVGFLDKELKLYEKKIIRKLKIFKVHRHLCSRSFFYTDVYRVSVHFDTNGFSKSVF